MKVLLVEDNPGDIRFLEEILVKTPRQDIELCTTPTLMEALQRLRQGQYDVVLLDLTLPDSHGVETVYTISQDFPSVPIVVLTGIDEEGLATMVMRSGAQDYIVKDSLNEHWIRRSMNYAVERKRLEQRLRTALTEAESASNAKTNFLASISHELRTPLNAVLGFADLMRQQIFGPLSNQYLEYAQNIHESGAYLLSLINDLLDIAKASVGKLELTETNVNVHQVGDQVVQMIKAQAQQKQIYIRTIFSPKTAYLWADEQMIKQIMLNLLGNALKFTPKLGQITISTFINRTEKTIGFFVQDTGIGVALKDQQRMFEPFIQLDSPQKRTTPGTGLGLSLVKHMVELHGGHIIVNSRPNQGTTFYVHFPLWRGEQNLTTSVA